MELNELIAFALFCVTGGVLCFKVVNASLKRNKTTEKEKGVDDNMYKVALKDMDIALAPERFSTIRFVLNKILDEADCIKQYYDSRKEERVFICKSKPREPSKVGLEWKWYNKEG